MIQSLRILEAAAGLALLFAPDKIEEHFKHLGIKMPTSREIRGLRKILG